RGVACDGLYDLSTGSVIQECPRRLESISIVEGDGSRVVLRFADSSYGFVLDWHYDRAAGCGHYINIVGCTDLSASAQLPNDTVVEQRTMRRRFHAIGHDK